MSQFTTQLRGQRKNQSKDFPSNVEHFQYQGGGYQLMLSLIIRCRKSTGRTHFDNMYSTRCAG